MVSDHQGGHAVIVAQRPGCGQAVAWFGTSSPSLQVLLAEGIR